MDNHDGWWRVLDANFNRCGEGLRVIEDWARFVANHVKLTQELKSLRHDLHNLATKWPVTARLQARDSKHDVGLSVQTEGEYTRDDAGAVLQANCFRVQQSLRSLEETSKLLRLGTERELELLRYRAYDIQKQVLLIQLAGQNSSSANPGRQLLISEDAETWTKKDAALRRELLNKATIYVLADGGQNFESYQAHIRQLIDAQVDVIQLRDKQLSDRQLWEYACWSVRELSNTSVLFIVNDRPDIAIASGADGVHVGQDELPVHQVRRLVGWDRLVGVSTHSIEQIQAAQKTTADYLGIGPVFTSSTKSFQEYKGLELLKSSSPVLERPAFAIGGIDLQNIKSVAATSIGRVAVQHALRPGQPLKDCCEALRRSLNSTGAGY